MNYVNTLAGYPFPFDDPDSARYTILTVAHALANQCRFNGHTRAYYSVAEHSVEVSYRVPPDLALIGLMHDAHEAFVGDIPTPIKRQLSGWDEFEDRIARSVRRRFGLPLELPEEVVAVDHRMFAVEAALLFPDHADWGFEIAPVHEDTKLYCLSPDAAKRQFVDRFRQLFGSTLV